MRSRSLRHLTPRSRLGVQPDGEGVAVHALFLVLQVDDEEQAVQALHRDVIPQMKQAPGFSTGTWFGNERSGHALMLFDTEEHARQAAPPVDMAMPGVTVSACDIYPVTGQA